MDQAVFHHPGIEKRPDELEHAFIGYPYGDTCHQPIVIDPVEGTSDTLPISATFRAR